MALIVKDWDNFRKNAFDTWVTLKQNREASAKRHIVPSGVLGKVYKNGNHMKTPLTVEWVVNIEAKDTNHITPTTIEYGVGKDVRVASNAHLLDQYLLSSTILWKTAHGSELTAGGT